MVMFNETWLHIRGGNLWQTDLIQIIGAMLLNSSKHYILSLIAVVCVLNWGAPQKKNYKLEYLVVSDKGHYRNKQKGVLDFILKIIFCYFHKLTNCIILMHV